ncbi:MAG: MGMT family protein [Gemmatimonadota bacterium]
MPDSVRDRIYEVVRCIPAGRVATYGQVATLAGGFRWRARPAPRE